MVNPQLLLSPPEVLLRPLVRGASAFATTAAAAAASSAARSVILPPTQSTISAPFSSAAAAPSSLASFSLQSSDAAGGGSAKSTGGSARAAICRELKAPLAVEANYNPAASPLATRISPDKRVRIGIRACGVNFADTLMVEGMYQVGLAIQGKL